MLKVRKEILYLGGDDVASAANIEALGRQYVVVHHPDSEAFVANLADDDGFGDFPTSRPLAIILDVPRVGGPELAVCSALHRASEYESTPIMFFAPSKDHDSVLPVYEAGASDFMAAPVIVDEVVIRLTQYEAAAQRALELSQQVSVARNMAFTAMSATAELGCILRFHEASLSIQDFSELGRLLLDTVQEFGVSGSITFFVGQEIYCSDDGLDRPLEREVLPMCRQEGRIYSWKQRTFFNYGHFSLLVRNMPVDNEERYGVLKDQLCILLNGLEGRVRAMLTERSNENRRRSIFVVSDTIGRMALDMEANNVKLSQQFEQVILNMEMSLSHDIVKFNLLEEEERAILGHVHEAIKQSTSIFERSLAHESEYRKIMQQLLASIAKSQ